MYVCIQKTESSKVKKTVAVAAAGGNKQLCSRLLWVGRWATVLPRPKP
jgi:hypothetical protein